MKKSLLTKNAQAIQVIAQDFMNTEIGERIKTVSEFETMIDVARGTIQNSIKLLTKTEAVVLISKGALGTYMVKKNLHLLLDFAGFSFIIGVMPLPYSRLYEGLSTGLLETMEQNLNIPVNMAYMRGASRRIEMILNNRYDFAIISKYAAMRHIEEDDDIQIIKEFPIHSYLNNHVLMTRKGEDINTLDVIKVGIDYDSIDQVAITKEIIKNKNVKLIGISYNQILEKLASKEIDGAVWNGDEINYSIVDIDVVSIPVKEELNTIAVIVINKERTELVSLLTHWIDEEKVIEIQKQILDGDKLPSY